MCAQAATTIANKFAVLEGLEPTAVRGRKKAKTDDGMKTFCLFV
jgi:hypothetical protein